MAEKVTCHHNNIDLVAINHDFRIEILNKITKRIADSTIKIILGAALITTFSWEYSNNIGHLGRTELPRLTGTGSTLGLIDIYSATSPTGSIIVQFINLNAISSAKDTNDC